MAKQANIKFWAAFHGGRYEDIPEVLNALTAAYLQNPGDDETASHVGFTHVWRLSDYSCLDAPPATITDEFVLARKYFAEASRLAPGDERIKGFLATMELGEASVHGDDKLKLRAYFNLMDAKAGWPEFNLFTAGYALSRLPFTDKQYAEAVEYQWQTLDLCAEQKVDRRTVQYSQYMGRETLIGRKRPCWNSAIAPHNFEGFFLNMGDMIVKQGEPSTARRVYANARLSRTYESWPFREVLDKRIADADENVAPFRQNRPGEQTRTMMVSSAFACAGCHQQ